MLPERGSLGTRAGGGLFTPLYSFVSSDMDRDRAILNNTYRKIKFGKKIFPVQTILTYEARTGTKKGERKCALQKQRLGIVKDPVCIRLPVGNTRVSEGKRGVLLPGSFSKFVSDSKILINTIYIGVDLK